MSKKIQNVSQEFQTPHEANLFWLQLIQSSMSIEFYEEKQEAHNLTGKYLLS